MVIACFVLGATPVLDVVAVALLAFHDAVDDTRGLYSRLYSTRRRSSCSSLSWWRWSM
jgi:hypothetical protein